MDELFRLQNRELSEQEKKQLSGATLSSHGDIIDPETEETKLKEPKSPQQKKRHEALNTIKSMITRPKQSR